MFKAYLDDKNKITIEGNIDSTFTINGVEFSSCVRSQDNKKLICTTYDDVDIENENYVLDNQGNKEPLYVRYYVKTDDFDNKYYYDGDDLGPSYHKHFTTFKVWAPLASDVTLVFHLQNFECRSKLERKEKGIFETTIKGDYDGLLYHYIITNNGVSRRCIDPYAYSSSANGKESAVINFDKIKIKEKKLTTRLESINDAIIYETSVRDFSSDEHFDAKVRGKYLAFLDKKKIGNIDIGINYLKDLGITHLQLMPILDFASVDETKAQDKQYNWGYDPYSYNTFDGSYSTYPNNPYSRLFEVKKMISSIHKRNIGVVLDVVYNHTYYKENSVYDDILPNYFYLMDKDGNLSNGSFCGNDVDTTRLMVKKYLLDITKRLIMIYDIDGLRFDLMGIIDKSLIKDIQSFAKNVKPSFIIYGEGWNMPSMLEESKRASLNNAKELNGVSFFNDKFREITFSYLAGKAELSYEFFKVMQGSIAPGYYFDNTSSSINYVECHDNYTLYDRLTVTYPNMSNDTKKRIIKCNLMAIMLAQGVPFIHSGMEFLRTKKGVENSYNSPIDVNRINWDDMVANYDVVKALKDFIKIRRTFSCFNIKDKKKLIKNVDGMPLEDGVLQITYATDIIVILLFNPTLKRKTITLPGEFKLYATQDGIENSDKQISEIELKSHSIAMLVR